MNIRIITASAGSGKTHQLTGELDAAIASGAARPEGIVATTFTTQAAAELIERARSRLLASGRGQAAHQLLAARIGTVNAVCGALVSDFAFELGMSPALRVLDEAAAELELRRALARVVSAELADELEAFKGKFDYQLDWRSEVQRIIEAARANEIAPERLVDCAERSIGELDRCLGPTTRTDDLDALLARALVVASDAISACGDDTDGTTAYLAFLQDCGRDLGHGRLRWGDWANLASRKPNKKAIPHAEPVQALARRHIEHPRLRAEMHTLIRRLFEVASTGLDAYQAHKRERGVVDFIDQETLALALLRRDDVRASLAGQIDLFLVDEFQDTSPIQLALFLELAKLAKSAIWVGDPKQAIYAFRGTDPALMDAAIESLTSPSNDPDLVTGATDAVGEGRVETLSTSYRSRPALVKLTSEVFARAFAHHGMPEDRTRLTPESETEPSGLGEVVEYWPLEVSRKEKTDNNSGRAQALATGVRDLLARRVNVRDHDGTHPVRCADIAVLCRTNVQCQAVADALAALDIAAVVPRMRLLDTLEGRIALAGLALWIDPDDALAAAELARVITSPLDLDAVIARALAAPGREAFRHDPTVVRIATARAVRPDLGPLAALDAVFGSTELRMLCAGWGDTPQRLANLDALRAHAVSYVEAAVANSDAVTVAGLIRYLDGLVESAGWSDSRGDRQALREGDDAVTVSTWHRAKGLEWPITVLFGLESMREPRAHGVHVMSDREHFDVAAPLAGRWIRCWPGVYTVPNQKGVVRDAYERSTTYSQLVARAAREALRVLYVGWTRARDRLVFAAERNKGDKLLDGIVGTLTALDPMLITVPSATVVGIEAVSWADVKLDLFCSPHRPAVPVPIGVVPGMVTVGREPQARSAARSSPSVASAVTCTLGRVVELGPRLPIEGHADMEDVGHAVHGFLAADRPGLSAADRLALASELLDGFAVGVHIRAADVVAAATRFWTWIDERHAVQRLHREWPVAHRTDAGTVISGTADLVIGHRGSFSVIDHKTFPGGIEAARERALGYSGQLAAYAAAIRAATGSPVAETWIHFPVLGCMLEVIVG